jgi:predicted RNA-binding Zn ribbon-like protein
MPPTTFRIGMGRPTLDLVATVKDRDGAKPHDRLQDHHLAEAWLRQAGFAAATPTEEDLDNLRHLREAAYHLLAIHAGRVPDEETLAHVDWINDLVATPTPAPALSLTTDGRIQSARSQLGAHHALVLLARDTVDLFTSEDVNRLHQCQAPTCGTYFLDTSRGAPRRWCTPTSCGNRARVSAHRQRKTS